MVASARVSGATSVGCCSSRASLVRSSRLPKRPSRRTRGARRSSRAARGRPVVSTPRTASRLAPPPAPRARRNPCSSRCAERRAVRSARGLERQARRMCEEMTHGRSRWAGGLVEVDRSFLRRNQHRERVAGFVTEAHRNSRSAGRESRAPIRLEAQRPQRSRPATGQAGAELPRRRILAVHGAPPHLLRDAAGADVRYTRARRRRPGLRLRDRAGDAGRRRSSRGCARPGPPLPRDHPCGAGRGRRRPGRRRPDLPLRHVSRPHRRRRKSAR